MKRRGMRIKMLAGATRIVTIGGGARLEGIVGGARVEALIALLLLLAGPLLLHANGGTLRVANAEVGPYSVSVFTDPTPVRPDTIDVSILITAIGENEVVPGLDVRVRAEAVDHDAEARDLPATREAADDSRYYAAKFSLGSIGRWRISVEVEGDDGDGATAFEVEAREPRLLDRPLVLIIVSLLPLLLAAWWFLRGAPEHGELAERGRQREGHTRFTEG